MGPYTSECQSALAELDVCMSLPFLSKSVSLIHRRSQSSCSSLMLFSYKVFQIFQSSWSQIGLLFNNRQWVCLWQSSRAYDGISLNIREQCDLENWV